MPVVGISLVAQPSALFRTGPREYPEALSHKITFKLISLRASVVSPRPGPAYSGIIAVQSLETILGIVSPGLVETA
jgi:hypothetical protein